MAEQLHEEKIARHLKHLSEALDSGTQFQVRKLLRNLSGSEIGDLLESLPITKRLAVWELNDRSHLSFNVSRAERAPASVELFSNGPHIATQSFEIGDPDLGKETNTHYEASYRIHQGAFTGSLTLYHDDFDHYIYEADTGEMEDGLPVRVWSQQDAEFTGGELEVRWDIGRYDSGHWQVFGFYDQVRATLPRLPDDPAETHFHDFPVSGDIVTL